MSEQRRALEHAVKALGEVLDAEPAPVGDGRWLQWCQAYDDGMEVLARTPEASGGREALADVDGMIEHMTSVMAAGGARIDPGEAHAMRDALEGYRAALAKGSPTEGGNDG